MHNAAFYRSGLTGAHSVAAWPLDKNYCVVHTITLQMLKSLGQVDLDEQVLHMTGRGVLAKGLLCLAFTGSDWIHRH